MDIQFNNLDSLHWLWLVGVLALITFVGFKLRKRRLQRFADSSLLQRLAPTYSHGKAIWRTLLSLSAMVVLVGAMLDPRWGVEYEEIQQQGIDLMFVLDVSNSMYAEDVKPNRLGRAKQSISDIVDQLGGDRVGVVGFAGIATLACPLTIDYGAFRLSLNEMSPETIGRGGSLLGDALRLAADSFTDDVKDHKAIVVFSDGEDHGSYALEAAQNIWEQKSIRIYSFGLGDSGDGARIPVIKDGQRTYLMHKGEQVWSKMQPDILRDIALAAGGAFVPVGTSTIDVARVFDEKIAPATKREFETARIQRYQVRYQWFAGLALALLLLESMTTERRAASSRQKSTREAYA
ncbi:MAG: VWA domain-containing protein [Planctomycetota bacterium]|nr:VWA domain-containing protein [Planctomycetota bacterium]